MFQLDSQTKDLIGGIVRELKDVRALHEDVLSFEKACTFKNRLIWFQNKAANLPDKSKDYIQTFLGALEEQVCRLFEEMEQTPRISILSEPENNIPNNDVNEEHTNAEVENSYSQNHQDKVIQLYPQSRSANITAAASNTHHPLPVNEAEDIGPPCKQDTKAGTKPAHEPERPAEKKPASSKAQIQKKEDDLQQQQLGALGLATDYLELLIEKQESVKTEKLINLKNELLHARQALMPPSGS